MRNFYVMYRVSNWNRRLKNQVHFLLIVSANQYTANKYTTTYKKKNHSNLQTHTHAHARTHTHTHIHTQTQTHTHTHIYKETYIEKPLK